MSSKTVNFMEAINSGKRFRTKDFPKSQVMSMWHEVKEGFIFEVNGGEFNISNPSFFNAQFELEEKTITITETELDKARFKVLPIGNLTKDEKYKIFKKELGF